MVVNLKTAKAIGVNMPTSLLPSAGLFCIDLRGLRKFDAFLRPELCLGAPISQIPLTA
jgi:hypothetical protein